MSDNENLDMIKLSNQIKDIYKDLNKTINLEKI